MTIRKINEYTDFPTMPTGILGSVDEVDEEVALIGYGELQVVTLFNKTSKMPLWKVETSLCFYRAKKIEDLYAQYD